MHFRIHKAPPGERRRRLAARDRWTPTMHAYGPFFSPSIRISWRPGHGKKLYPLLEVPGTILISLKPRFFQYPFLKAMSLFHPSMAGNRGKSGFFQEFFIPSPFYNFFWSIVSSPFLSPGLIQPCSTCVYH